MRLLIVGALLAGCVIQGAIPLGAEPLEKPGATSSVTVNGAVVLFERKTEERSMTEVLAGVERSCASRDPFGARDVPTTEGTASHLLTLERILTQEADGDVKASLCVFAPEPGASPDALRRVRYTLVRAIDARTTSVTTIVSTSCTPLETLFPREGDAPGSDPKIAARPADARRTLTAIAGTHEVRVYETSLRLPAAITSYDASMIARGFAVTARLDDARMYRRPDGTSFVASFEPTSDGSTIAIAPFFTPRT